jgi:type III restriction enzyme
MGLSLDFLVRQVRHLASAFSEVITPADTTAAIPKSLYEAKKNDMNNRKNELLDAMVALSNVKWWHKIIERKGFRLNGYIYHYPNFMVIATSKRIVIIEYKGDDRDNSDSERKLKLGHKRQAQSGQNYRYFLAFAETKVRSRLLQLSGEDSLDR